MSEHTPVVVEQTEEQLVLKKYVVGFVGSVGLTLAAYLISTRGNLSVGTIMVLLSVLALLQFMTQMIFFLHLGTERKPRWKLGVLCFMLGVVLILVVGSIWIMNNLNYHMTPQQMQQYLKNQDSL